MPAWEDYKKTAKERGALAFELFVVETTPSAGPEEMQANLPAHLAYQKDMEAAGKLFLAGPLSDSSGDLMEGCGLIIYRASSLQEAKDITDADPMHTNGVRTYTIRKWLVNEGSRSFGTALSSQRVIVR